MEKAYQILNSKSNFIHICLLCCCGLSALITLERPDYNLFLFIFVAFSIFWNKNQIVNSKVIEFERLLCFITMSASLLVDLIWIYSHSEINSSIIIFLSWVEFLIKIIVIAIVFVMWKVFKKEGKGENEPTEFNPLDEAGL